MKIKRNIKSCRIASEFADLSALKIMHGKNALKTIAYSAIFISKECKLIDQNCGKRNKIGTKRKLQLYYK